MDPSCSSAGNSSDLKEVKAPINSIYWLVRFRFQNTICYRIHNITSNLRVAHNTRRGELVRIVTNDVVQFGRVVAASSDCDQLTRNADALINEDFKIFKVDYDRAQRERRNSLRTAGTNINRMRNIVHFWFKQMSEKVLNHCECVLFNFDMYKIVMKSMNYNCKSKFVLMVLLHDKVLVSHCLTVKKKKTNPLNAAKIWLRDLNSVVSFINVAFKRCKVTIMYSIRNKFKTNCTEQYRQCSKRKL